MIDYDYDIINQHDSINEKQFSGTTNIIHDRMISISITGWARWAAAHPHLAMTRIHSTPGRNPEVHQGLAAIPRCKSQFFRKKTYFKTKHPRKMVRNSSLNIPSFLKILIILVLNYPSGWWASSCPAFVATWDWHLSHVLCGDAILLNHFRWGSVPN